jgi:arsenate reductase
MRKIWHLGSCDTCGRILGQLPEDLERQEIRSSPIQPEQLDQMAELAGGFAPLLSRRARKYRELGLKESSPSEQELRALILEHDTLLQRPVAIVGARIFIGSSKKTQAALQEALT